MTTAAKTKTENFIVAVMMQGNWYKAGVITIAKKKLTLDTVSKKNFTGENRKRLIESCEYLQEESSATSVEWFMVNGKPAKTYKVKSSNN